MAPALVAAVVSLGLEAAELASFSDMELTAGETPSLGMAASIASVTLSSVWSELPQVLLSPVPRSEDETLVFRCHLEELDQL